MEEPILISEEKLLKEQEFILAEKKAIKDSALLNGDYEKSIKEVNKMVV